MSRWARSIHIETKATSAMVAKALSFGEEPRCESGEGCHGPEPLAGRRIGGPSEACQREEGEEAGENLGAPRNVGNGFRVHRVNGKEQRGHPGGGGGP